MRAGTDQFAATGWMGSPEFLQDPKPSIDTLHAMGVLALDHLELDTLPNGGTVAILGRPSEMDGVVSGLAEALENRGYKVWIGCQWLEGVRPVPGQFPSAYGVVQDYRDEPAEEVAMAIIVQTTMMNPAIAVTSLLWALDNVPTRQFGIVSLIADQAAILDLQEIVDLADLAPLDVSVGYPLHGEQEIDVAYRALHHLLSDSGGGRDDKSFVPQIIAARRERRREIRTQFSGPRV